MGRNYKGIGINTTSNTHEVVFSMLDQNPENTIADIPAGGGAFIQRLKDSGFKNVIAVDIVNILEIEHDNFMLGDMTKELSLESNSCNSVVCIDGIEHIGTQFSFVAEVNRVLKMGGEFILSTPNISSLRSRAKWLFTGHHLKCNVPLDENNPNPLHHIGMISFHELRYLLHTNGFEVTEIRTNRIKFVSWLYGILLPFIYLRTAVLYSSEGKKANLSKMYKEILKSMFTKEVLFGETIILKGVKRKDLKH